MGGWNPDVGVKLPQTHRHRHVRTRDLSDTSQAEAPRPAVRLASLALGVLVAAVTTPAERSVGPHVAVTGLRSNGVAEVGSRLTRRPLP